MTITLSDNELQYLTLYLKEHSCSFFIKYDNKKVEILESDGGRLTELLGEELINHFDKDYNPTETGVIIESIIDKLYLNNNFSYRPVSFLNKVITTESKEIIIVVNESITNTTDLIFKISNATQCPCIINDLHGLKECLCDLCWLREPRIKIIHFALPAINKIDLLSYIAVMEQVESYWYKDKLDRKICGDDTNKVVSSIFVDELLEPVSAIVDQLSKLRGKVDIGSKRGV